MNNRAELLFHFKNSRMNKHDDELPLDEDASIGIWDERRWRGTGACHMRECFAFVPMQDFTRSWTDADLYAKYGLTDEEIVLIESMIKPIE